MIGLSQDITECACNPGFYLGNPQADVKCSACPPYTTSAENNTEATVLGCRCLAGYYCTYTKRVTAKLHLNLTISAFDAGSRSALIQAIAHAAGVPVESVKITCTKQRKAGGRRKLQPLAESWLEVKVSLQGVEHLKSFSLHFAAKQLLRSRPKEKDQNVVLGLEWAPDHSISVSKII